jgi:hypothetical protein
MAVNSRRNEGPSAKKHNVIFVLSIFWRMLSIKKISVEKKMHDKKIRYKNSYFKDVLSVILKF